MENIILNNIGSIISIVFIVGMYYQILKNKADKSELKDVQALVDKKVDKEEFIMALGRVNDNIRKEITTHVNEQCPFEYAMKDSIFPKIDGKILENEIKHIKEDINSLHTDNEHIRTSLHDIKNSLQQIIGVGEISEIIRKAAAGK